MLVPPAKNQRTVRPHWGRFAQRLRISPGKYHADWRELLWLGLVLSAVVAVICGLWLALPTQPRRDVKSIDRIVSPMADRNDDGYVEKLGPILGWMEP